MIRIAVIAVLALSWVVAPTWQPDERWQISASFENLFDKQYRHHGSGIDAVGRNLTVSFQASW